MRALLVLFLIGLLAVPARGQTIWSRPYEPNQLAVEAVVPDPPEDASVLSGATFLTGTVSLSDNIRLAAELPVARFDAAAGGVSSTTALGNPYLGFGVSGTNLPVLVQLGARLPAASSNAATRLGQSADIGRIPAFRPEELALSSLLNGRLSIGRNASLRLRTGVVFASRSGSDGRDRNWRLLYEAQAWQEGDRFITGVSVAGQARLGDRSTEHHAIVSVMGNLRRVQPGLLAGVSLNDLYEDGTFAPVVGLTLSVSYLRN